jgi:uncharacterized protein YuzE
MEKKHCLLQRIGISIQRTSPKEIEAIYIKVSDNKVSKSKEIGPNGEAVIDLDKNGGVVGIEMLEPGTISVRLFKKITRDYNLPELKNIKIDRLQEAFA